VVLVKKVLAITVMLLLCAAAAMAAADNWRIYIDADYQNGTYSGPDGQIGVYPSSTDEFDSQDKEMAWVTMQPTVAILGTIREYPGVPYKVWSRELHGYTAPGTNPIESWTLVAAAGSSYAYSTMRVLFKTPTSPSIWPAPMVIDGTPITYKLTLTRVPEGVVGAPAVGTTWIWDANNPLPTTLNTVFWQLTLPAVKLGFNDNDFIAGGYLFTFEMLGPEEVIPEPSSLLALGSGLVGLVGFIARKRRA
jgi:hypothetical protein